jgi:ABC-type Mn2+/Zn2+ transport system ATPase subunit
MTAPVECSALAAGYGGEPAVTGITFAARSGERVAVLGPNGGGKTTLFRVLAGELPALEGTARVSGRIGWVPQTERSRLDFPVSALDVALMGSLGRLEWWRRPGRAERRSARNALREVGLDELADATFGSLSGGQRQRVLIARALVQEASVLLLDEPFAGLDARSADRLLVLIDELAAAGRTILIATHDLDQARAWDSVLCLNRRQVAFGHPAETLTRRVLEETYGGSIVEIPGAGGALGVLPPHHHDHGSEAEDAHSH